MGVVVRGAGEGGAGADGDGCSTGGCRAGGAGARTQAAQVRQAQLCGHTASGMLVDIRHAPAAFTRTCSGAHAAPPARQPVPPPACCPPVCVRVPLTGHDAAHPDVKGLQRGQVHCFVLSSWGSGCCRAEGAEGGWLSSSSRADSLGAR